MNISFIMSLLRFALTFAAIFWIAVFFNDHRLELARAFANIDLNIVSGSMLWVLIGLIPGAMAWQRILARKLPEVKSARGILIYLFSSIGKYTPGGVLAFAIQHRLLEESKVGTVLLLRIFTGTALAACLAAMLIGIPAIAVILGVQSETLGMSAVAIASILFGVIGVTCRQWPWFPDLLERVGVPPPAPFVIATVTMAAGWILTGLHLAMLGINSQAGSAFLVSAYALSAIVGIVFAVLPGALGVRDGALLLILSVRLEPADAMALALLSRALIISGDVIGAAAAAAALGWASAHTKAKRDLT